MFALAPLGLIDTLIAAGSFAFGSNTRLAGLFLLMAWCGIWVLLLYRFADDYLASLRLEAARWCAVALGLWFTGVALVFALGGGAEEGVRFAMPAVLIEPQWPALLGAFVFYLAFDGKRLRGTAA
ncbi:hypothetical protein [Aurantiacibacter luteus]|nr:hypothetical protein [Aurantiacibacter luteus]